MGFVPSYLSNDVFDPSLTRAMGHAYELAGEKMRCGGQSDVVHGKADYQAARDGERDSRLSGQSNGVDWGTPAIDWYGLYHPALRL
jgi:hypothetical protein